MAVRQISGTGEPQEPEKKKKKVDADGFREMMKVGKAREVDPEEQRKRKRREESQEELQAQVQAPLPPAPLPSEAKEEIQDKFKLTIGETGAMARPSIQRTPEEDSEMTSSETEEEEPPTFYPPPEPSVPSEFYPLPMEQPAPSAPPTQREKETERAPEVTPTKAPTRKRKREAKAPQEKKPVIKKAEISPRPVSGLRRPIEEAPLTTEKKETFFEQLAPPSAKEKKEELPAEEQIVIPGAPPPLPMGAWESTKEKEKEKEIIAPTTEIAGLQPDLTPAGAPAITPPAGAVPVSYAFLHPQVMELFDRMVGVMTVMQATGVNETTINLNAPQFATSVFYGAQIVIKEFSTAPKAFNIELKGNPPALALFQGNVEELLAAFQTGNYNFKVNRIDTSLLAAARMEKERKGKVAGVKKLKKDSEGGP